LFSGKTQLVKSDCDQATALKYKVVMQRAGAEPTVSVIRSESEQADTGVQSSQTAAEKIAAVAASSIADPGKTTAASIPVSVAQPEHTVGTEGTKGIELAPLGTDVLRTNERAVLISCSLDTSDLEMNTLGQRLSQEPSPAPAMPDTSHLMMAAAGELIPNLPLTSNPVSPNFDDLTLSPADFDFSDCAALEGTFVPHDRSVLSLASSDD
jgi:hypothetical protein